MTDSFPTKLSLALAALTLTTGAQANMLKELYQQARSYDAELLAAQAQANAGLQAEPITRAQLLPSLTFNASATQTNRNNRVTEGMGLSLSQPLFDLSKWYSYQGSKHLTEQAKLAIEAAEQGLIIRVVNAYLDILSAKATLDVARSREKALQRRLDQVNAQFDVGLIAITDVLEARASYDDARVALIDAEGNLANSFELMQRLTGTTLDSIAELSPEYPITGLAEREMQRWVDKARDGNLNLRIAKLEEQYYQKSLESSRAADMPTVNLGIDAVNNDLASSYDSRIGITLTLPLFRGGAISASEQKAAFEAIEKQHAYENSLRTLTQDTRSLVRDMETSVESVEARSKSIESRETALDATEQGFEVGTRNVVDVLDAENALYEARQAYVDARLNHIRTQFSLQAIVGTLSPEDVVRLDNWLKP